MLLLKEHAAMKKFDSFQAGCFVFSLITLKKNLTSYLSYKPRGLKSSLPNVVEELVLHGCSFHYLVVVWTCSS